MIIRGRDPYYQRSEKKWQLAQQITQLDYIEASHNSNIFLNMTKAEEHRWERARWNAYYDNFTATELEKLYNIRKGQLGF